ncbi:MULTISPECIES: cytochrome P450 [Streptomyces]|uniref:Cytochrome P450 n=2 Tax=Streptomyces TaxID=1883 RepID=A0A8H9LR95_9ACTN|nr:MULTISPECIES: cytochrome P450 [Streptomyces]MDQ0293052.1 cytochrome P450 [Streptomyces sp. DSM 41037]WPR53406.1 cytochrome P450 [Streptomyces sp. S399]SUO95728.1 cytochrome P450 [Streptomyces griseus]GFH67798.1 cytochrome P450 [Streptomyces rutgersensis]GFH76705.1 cytochrome P450 [Streptomyces gougerotii]
MRLTPGPPRDIDLDTVDLFDLDLYGTGDPHAVWDVMRAEAPLHHQVLPDGRDFWSVTRYEDVCRVLGDHREFTSERGTVPTHLGQDDVAAGVLLTSTDPPRHTEVRRPLGSRFTARAVRSWEDSIRRSVTRFLEPALDGEVFDLAEKALLLPALVTGPLLGIPEKDWEELVQLTAMVAAPCDPHFQLGSEAATLAISHHELVGYVTEWVKERRRSGAEDDSLLHHLMSVRPGGAPLSDREIALDGYSILLGANVTTPHTVSGTVQALIERPEQYGRAQADPGLIPDLVEEGLRWTSAACNFMRHAATDVPVAGGVIPAGAAVVAWIGSANRDAALFAAPHTFDITRPNAKRQIAFGFGSHFCIGAPLARLTLRVFFEELLRRFDSLALAGEPDHLRSYFIAGMTHLPITAQKRRTP